MSQATIEHRYEGAPTRDMSAPIHVTGGAQRFEHKHWPQVAPDCCGCCGPNCCETMSLTLDEEEMILRRTDCCGNSSEQKRPYAQLGNVETSQDCCGTWSIKTDGLSGPEGGGLAPGTACSNKQLVEEIAAALQARKIGRGNVGQIREAELMKQEVALLHTKVDLILQHLQIQPPQPEAMARGATMMQVTLPSDCAEGQQITVAGPTGQNVVITVPKGASPGSTITVQA